MSDPVDAFLSDTGQATDPVDAFLADTGTTTQQKKQQTVAQTPPNPETPLQRAQRLLRGPQAIGLMELQKRDPEASQALNDYASKALGQNASALATGAADPLYSLARPLVAGYDALTGGNSGDTLKTTIDARNAQFAQDQQGNPNAGLMRAGGQAAATAPAFAGAGELIGNALTSLKSAYPAIAPYADFVTGRLGAKTIANPEDSALTNIANKGLEYGSKAIGGAGAGALATPLLSSSSDAPVSDQLKNNMEFGAAMGAGVPMAFDAGAGLAGGAKSISNYFTGNAAADQAKQLIETRAGNPITGMDTSEIVPGSYPTLAEATGNPNLAVLQESLRNTPEGKNLDADLQAENNNARINHFENVAGNPQDLQQLIQEREDQRESDVANLWKPGQAADPGPVMKTINRVMNDPQAGENSVVEQHLTDLRNKLTEANPLSDRVGDALPKVNAVLQKQMSNDNLSTALEARRLLNSANRGYTSEEDLISGLKGLKSSRTDLQDALDGALSSIQAGDTRLKTDPQRLYGIRRDFNEKVNDLSASASSNDRAAAVYLGKVRDSLDSAIDQGVGGDGQTGPYKTYMQNYADASKGVEGAKFLQNLQLKDNVGNITLPKVQSALNRIDTMRKANGVNPAKNLGDDQIKALTDIRDDLLRKEKVAKAGMSRGSPTIRNAISEQTMPGAKGMFSDKLNPEVVGAVAGNLIGTGIGGHPLIGSVVGDVAGRVAKAAGDKTNAKVTKQLLRFMYNPETYSPSAKAAGGGLLQNPNVRSLGEKLVPSALMLRGSQ